MNLIELTTQKQALTEMLTRLERIQVSCLNCEHYHQRLCKKFNATPPLDTIKTGCPEWVYDGCPF